MTEGGKKGNESRVPPPPKSMTGRKAAESRYGEFEKKGRGRKRV